MNAPNAPGPSSARNIPEGAATPALIAASRTPAGHAKALALLRQKGLGCTRARSRKPLTEETETRSFRRTSGLCGGVSETDQKPASITLVLRRDIKPKSLLRVHAMNETIRRFDLSRRPHYMTLSSSDTAEQADYSAGTRIITQRTREEIAEDPPANPRTAVCEKVGRGKATRAGCESRHAKARNQAIPRRTIGPNSRHAAFLQPVRLRASKKKADAQRNNRFTQKQAWNCKPRDGQDHSTLRSPASLNTCSFGTLWRHETTTKFPSSA